MKNYYQILEVSKDASQDEIKRSYRSLAKKYHPDKTSYEDADKLFAAINEAYEVLGDPDKRRQYNNFEQASSHVYDQHRATRPRPNYQPASSSQVDVASYVKYFKKASLVGLMLSLVLTIDFILPRSVSMEQVVTVQNIVARSRGGRQYVIGRNVITNVGSYKLGSDLSINIYRGQRVETRSSILLGLPTSVDFFWDNAQERYEVGASIYHNFSFILIILLITSIIGSFLKKPPITILNCGIVNGVLTLLVIYFVAVS